MEFDESFLAECEDLENTVTEKPHKLSPPAKWAQERTHQCWLELVNLQINLTDTNSCYSFVNTYRSRLFQHSDNASVSGMKKFFLHYAKTHKGISDDKISVQTLVHYVGLLRQANNRTMTHQISEEMADEVKEVRVAQGSIILY